MLKKANRFEIYLSPILGGYGNTFKKQLNKVLSSVVGYAVFDYAYYKVTKYNSVKPFIFVLFDRKGKKVNEQYVNPVQAERDFLEFLKYVRTSGDYVEDYSENLDNLHWILLEIPERFINAHTQWVRGRYSQMYSSKDLNDIGIYQIYKGKISPLYLILTKHPMALDNLKIILEKRYGTNVVPDEPDEYDIRPVWKEEIYNYESSAMEIINKTKQQ